MTVHVVSGVLAALLLTDVAVATARAVDGTGRSTAAVACSLPPTASAHVANRTGTAAARILPSVVALTATSNAEIDTGSGVVIRADGLILTNNHVVAAVGVNGGNLEVTLSDGRSAHATIVGRDPRHDIAVVAAEGLHGLHPAALGSSSDLRVGDAVLAIGDALGQHGTVTSGIVSALDRTACVTTSPAADAGHDIFGTLPSLPEQTTLDDLIQTDASINPGNSGGALVDLSGRVVGITTLALTAGNGVGSNGIGFAIPIELAYRTAQSLLRTHAR